MRKKHDCEGDGMMILRVRFRAFCCASLLCGLMAASSAAWGSGEVPAPPQSRDILLLGGTVHPVSGQPVQADILFSKGKIVAIGRDLATPGGDVERIDISGRHVYPGFIDAATDLGLTEIGSVRATRDQFEAGTINPNARAEVAVNPDSELIPVTRANGVLMAVTSPDGGVISGTSALIQLDGWTWEDMTIKAPLAMAMVWPSMTATRAWWQRESERDQLRQRDERLKQIQQVFTDARAYMVARQSDNRPDFDARWEAMIPLLERKIPLAVSANEVQQIQSAVALAEQEKLRLIIVGGADAPQCADLLKKYDVPVIITGTQRLPQRRWAGYDEAFTLPQRLKEAGIRFCIAGSRSASYSRNLPYQAGMAVAFGLDREDAIKAITLYPAQILGVSERVGSLSPGMDATLIVTSGDPLETPTHVEQAYIQGRRIELTSRHTRLRDKYQEKYRQQETRN
jgi:imidazolonepropionase-like amidohydrolase